MEDRPRKHVVAAIIERDGRVLLAQRGEDSAFAGLWEFPGGKVEPGETNAEALQREILEELGVAISVRPEAALAVVDWEYEHVSVRLFAMRAEITDGEPQPLDHAQLRWVPIGEITDVSLLPADGPIARQLAGDQRQR